MRSVLKTCCQKLTDKELDEACAYGISIYPQFHKFIKMNKGVKKALEKLKAKFRLGIVTSRIGTKILDDLDLRKFFDHVVTFNDYTKPKQHPEPMVIALKKFDILPQEAVYVGDSQKDVDCSKNAGVKSIIFGDGAIGDWNITNFSQILDILDNLNIS